MNARDITSTLRGKWHGSHGTALCPAHDDKRPSLSVSDGDGNVLFYCHAGCSQGSVLREFRRRGMLPGRADRDHHIPCLTAAERQARQKADERERASRIAAALTIWRECKSAPGTCVETYLRRRGITIPVPPSIRYHPALKHGPTGQLFPAMVAGVQGPDGWVIAVHRTYLLPGGSGKAQVREPKMALGPVAGGACRLAAVGPTLALCEGVETGLSVLQSTGLPVWACLSTSGLRGVILPETVREVVLCADGDEPGQSAAEAAAQRFIGEGRTARNASPPAGYDFNDILLMPENVVPLDTRRNANGHG